MRTVVVDEKHGGKRIDRFLKEAFPNMPVSAMYKAFRKRDIKVNGTRIKDDYIVAPGDVVEVYIVDNVLDGVRQEDGHVLNKGFSVVYEDKNILIANKEQGIPVHPDKDPSEITLIDSVKTYLAEKGEYNPRGPDSSAPSLCHRLDRNTGGLVIIAKNDESLKILLEKIKQGEVRKFYQCLVKGRMEKGSTVLKAYLLKDEKKSRVFIHDEKKKDALEIITAYRVLSYDAEHDISRLEVELLTGRTHQIRAHLAHVGHPIIGDGKYGTNAVNRPLGAKQQALWAYKIVFDFKGKSGLLDYLKGKHFEVEPDFNLKLKKQD